MGVPIVVWQAGPYRTARAQVGSRVFVVQGPPLEEQIAQDPKHAEYARCVMEHVRLNVKFASVPKR